MRMTASAVEMGDEPFKYYSIVLFYRFFLAALLHCFHREKEVSCDVRES